MKKMFFGACVVAVAASAITAFGAEKVFTGAVDAKWSTPGNWQGGEIPVNGDAVTLASTTRTTINNDIEGLTLASFTFSGYGNQGASGGNNNAFLQGKAIKIAAGGAIRLTSTVRINQQMTIELLEGAHELEVSTASGARWDTQSAGFSGAGSLTFTQGLLVIYAASTFSGGFTAKSGSNTYLFHSNGLGAGAVREQRIPGPLQGRHHDSERHHVQRGELEHQANREHRLVLLRHVHGGDHDERTAADHVRHVACRRHSHV